MAENLMFNPFGSKEETYKELLPQLIALVESESNHVANQANVVAALKSVFGFFWVGFYIVDGKELVLGPFQGPIACTRIVYGRGVCGTAWANSATILVPDVDKFPGHIACDAASRSELVTPLVRDGVVFGVLDLDSPLPGRFTAEDQAGFEALAALYVSASDL